MIAVFVGFVETLGEWVAATITPETLAYPFSHVSPTADVQDGYFVELLEKKKVNPPEACVWEDFAERSEPGQRGRSVGLEKGEDIVVKCDVKLVDHVCDDILRRKDLEKDPRDPLAFGRDDLPYKADEEGDDIGGVWEHFDGLWRERRRGNPVAACSSFMSI